MLSRYFIRSYSTILKITESASTQILKITNETTPSLRIAVDSGGCSGFQYVFQKDTPTPDDVVITSQEGAKVTVDKASLEFVKGSTLDYTRELIGDSFIVVNPNAESTCGCKVSFNIKTFD